jgi:hypothetical protein
MCHIIAVAGLQSSWTCVVRIPFCIEPACGSNDTDIFDVAVYIPLIFSCCELHINIDPNRVM